MEVDTLIVIPARYASTRFPGKPLVDIAGKSMIQRVYERCMEVEGCDVCVATDDQRIMAEVERFGGMGLMTDSGHLTGTDRVGEVARKKMAYAQIINVQGDEPFISPLQVAKVRELLEEGAAIATLLRPLEDAAKIQSPDIVKAAFSQRGRVLYFSRASIPYVRHAREGNSYFQHIGIYGFQRKILLELVELDPSPLELTESLEQLRWLENAYEIRAKITKEETFAIDRPEDLEKLMANRAIWEGNVGNK